MYSTRPPRWRARSRMQASLLVREYDNDFGIEAVSGNGIEDRLVIRTRPGKMETHNAAILPDTPQLPLLNGRATMFNVLSG